MWVPSLVEELRFYMLHRVTKIIIVIIGFVFSSAFKKTQLEVALGSQPLEQDSGTRQPLQSFSNKDPAVTPVSGGHNS